MKHDTFFDICLNLDVSPRSNKQHLNVSRHVTQFIKHIFRSLRAESWLCCSKGLWPLWKTWPVKSWCEVFLFSWQSRAFAVKEKWCRALCLPPLHFSARSISAGRQRFYSPLPDSLLISSLFYRTVTRNGERNDEPFLYSLTEAAFYGFLFRCLHFSIPLSAVTPLHIFLLGVSPPMSTSIGLNQAAWRKNEEECVRVRYFFLKEGSRWKTRSSLSFLSHSLDNQVVVWSGGRLKGACVEAQSAGASAPRGHLGPFDSIQASLHLVTCP